MELRLQPKPVIEVEPADKGIVSRENYFVTKVLEEINQYFFPGHLIRTWRPKAELIYSATSADGTAVEYECDFNRDVQSCFVEDNAEEVYLRSPPPCFVVLGKSGDSVRTLGRNLAEEYGSVLIEVDTVVDQVLATDTQTAKFLDKVLRLGVSLTLSFVLSLLSYFAHTPESRHRGYVLSGLPCLPLVHGLTVEQQFNYLFCWENKPTVFVYVLFEDEDLVASRSCQRYEVTRDPQDETRTVIVPRVKCDDPPDDDGDKEAGKKERGDDAEEDNAEPDVPEPDIDVSPSRPWVKLPRDQVSHVWTELEFFDYVIKPALNVLVARIDPQYFITVDSRVGNEFEIVKARLSLLHVTKSPVPFPFYPPKDDSEDLVQLYPDEQHAVEEDEEGEVIEDGDIDEDMKRVISESPETSFLTLFAKKTLSPKFRWELSHYNYVCPVSLRAGEVVEGRTEFAVAFMKYIFFLRDRDAMMQFLRNPRPFVLPVRPKPPVRFFIIGYPYCGKTTLATSLASKFSATLIDLKSILVKDLRNKKDVYREFCKQKAESRELVRLTAQAWKDWQMEEDQRIALIEDWIEFIQSLLAQRIEQFYTAKVSDNDMEGRSRRTSRASTNRTSHSGLEGTKHPCTPRDFRSLEVRGVPIQTVQTAETQFTRTMANYTTPSTKLMHAFKHEDYNFDKPGLEVEANLFFSTLWNTFSKESVTSEPYDSITKSDMYDYDYDSDRGEYGESSRTVSIVSIPGEELADSRVSVNWCHLLPPQSLSSLLLSRRKLTTTRERHRSFRILLSAASKAYWEPSALKLEFAKWRLPCYMDIPLCEIFLDNPILLYKYCPDWIKQRPLIPDPIDPMHPSVAEAGRLAYYRAGGVTLHHYTEEIGILLRNEIEKAEKDGMRITGDVMTPGSWVVDNMVLDLRVWCMLVKDNITPTHVYSLVDSEPDFRRIINMWYDTCNWTADTDVNVGKGNDSDETTDMDSGEAAVEDDDMNPPSVVEIFENLQTKKETRVNVVDLLRDSCLVIANGEPELDEVLDMLLKDGEIIDHGYMKPVSVDLFSYNILQNKIHKTYEGGEEIGVEESTLVTINFGSQNAPSLFSTSHASDSFHDRPLGAQLQSFTDKVLNLLQRKLSYAGEDLPDEPSTYEKGIEFFFMLLKLSQKLDEVKEWLNSLNRDIKIVEIDIRNKTQDQIFTDIVNDLYRPFIKKPRELEAFEIEEIEQAAQMEETLARKAQDGDETEPTEAEEEPGEDDTNEPYDDIRIYGESGPFCIVNLERNILLRGNPEHVLRYYGKLYYFWNADCKAKFIENPEKYAPYYSPIRCLPPLRVFIIGPFGSHKSTTAALIAHQCGLHYADYLINLNSKLLPYNSGAVSRIRSLNKSLLLSNAGSPQTRALMDQFKNTSHKKKQFWLENPPFCSESWEKENTIRELLKLDDLPNLKDVRLNYITVDLSLSDTNVLSSSSTAVKSSASSGPAYQSMYSLEALLNHYVHGDAPLTDYCVNKTIGQLWNKHPFVTEGFVLKDFPMRASDIRVVLENNWLPDLIVEVEMSEDEVLERNIEHLMEVWDTRLKQETIQEELVEDTIRTIYDMKALMRRLDIMHGDETRRSTDRLRQSFLKYSAPWRNSNKGKDSIPTDRRLSEAKSVATSEAMDEADVEEIIRSEFPPLVFNPRFETYADGKARVTADVLTNYRKDASELEKIKYHLENMNIPWYKIQDPENVNEIFVHLNDLKKRRYQRGEFAFPVSLDMAERLLRQGYYFLSKFGRLCPVQAYRRKNPVNMFRPLEPRGKIFPIVYRTYIYFVAGENEKVKFIEDPIKYTFPEPHHPNIPLRLAVVGPPKSGKSTLCKRLGIMFGLRVVTMGSAIRFVLERMENSGLRKSIDSYLRKGCFLPLSLKVEALLASLNDPACATQGFVLDGVPFDAAMTQSLAEKKKLPFIIISLVGNASFGKKNRENLDLTTFRLPYKQRVNLDVKYREWTDTYAKFSQWNQTAYDNVSEINADLNAADVFYRAYDIFRKPYFDILNYVEYCVTDKPLPLQYLCVSQQEYEQRRSELYDNCPICWSEKFRLKPSTVETFRPGLVQYGHHYYWVCSDHMEKFLKSPKKYLPPVVEKWPEALPQFLNTDPSERIGSKWRIHGRGRCPVTCTDFPDSLNWEGSWKYAATYLDEVFLCRNEEMLERFMAQPWRYHKADTTYEKATEVKSTALERLGPPKVTSLPPIGFLEQTVSSLIQQALQILGSVRPVYPNLTPTCTGCIFLALYLKVHNKYRVPTDLEREYLEFMLYYCKAYRFRVPFRVERDIEEGQGDFLRDLSESMDSTSKDDVFKTSQGTISSADSRDAYADDSTWKDLDSQPDKKIWSARYKSSKGMEMLLTEADELQEIKEVPHRQIVVRYHNTVKNPLPPVDRCLTYIYCRRNNLELPQKFKVNSMHQPPPAFVSPYAQDILCNPMRQFEIELYSRNTQESTSEPNLFGTPLRYSSTEFELEGKTVDVDETSRKLCIPRFQILSVSHPKVDMPKVTVFEYTPIVFEPQRDYTYTMLFSHFFQTGHYIRTYEWDDNNTHFEYADINDRSLGLCNVRSNFFYKPEVSVSQKSLTSIVNYQQIFDASSTFYYRPFAVADDDSSDSGSEDSCIDFIRILLIERLDDMFARMQSTISMETYDSNIFSLGSQFNAKYEVVIQEVLPYPPLIWDIISRPYYSYQMIPSIFHEPRMDNIAHERHVSLLDGITEPYENFRYVRYATLTDTWNYVMQEDKNQRAHAAQAVDNERFSHLYCVYDFFNIGWASYLNYPTPLVYEQDMMDNFESQRHTANAAK